MKKHPDNKAIILEKLIEAFDEWDRNANQTVMADNGEVFATFTKDNTISVDLLGTFLDYTGKGDALIVEHHVLASHQ